jgi:hypothetical protein
MRVMMSEIEVMLSVAIGALAIALTIVSLRMYRHERSFNSIQALFTMIGHKLHAIDHALDIEHDHKETKKNVKV